ncbi:MAG: enoyl-[acyl-carrier-protein] reductase FabK [Coriobacteriia bacterium]|nr:enoyl-[acyl-carrier-protein] reductase FabK [Coriobacteriia bacterium]
MIKTKLTDLLGIEYPLFQGAMAWISDGELAAAVSNAGGIGIIGGGSAPASWIADQIRRARELTDKPFGVNIPLISPYVDEVADLLVADPVAVITTGAGNAGKYIARWDAVGTKVIPVIPSVALARRAEKEGAAAVIAEGGESGGHIGELNTMALVPQVVDAVSIPVLAAGGIGDGRGVAAAFMLGAEGVQMGTRFVVATECNVHPNYKRKILEAKDRETITTGKRLGHPVRCLKNPFSRSLAAKEADENVSLEELEGIGVGALRLAAVEGDLENGCFMSGEIAGLVTREQSAVEIVTELFTEAEALLTGRAQELVCL